LRLALQITILLLFVGLLAFIVAIIIIHPGCEKEPKIEWWSKSIIYRIELEKFKELGKADSIFKSLNDNLEYFEENNVDAIWLSSIVDLDYNFTHIHGSFGSLADFNDLIKKFHEKEIKVILDFIPNHTTDKSEWFLKSKQNDLAYRDYYIWSDISPNNWVSIFWRKN
jgi:alpha-glucosidase